ncbi:MAG: DoxX family protein [Saprospiraceae bacterium]|nr:DoxX family protein [Saprospiraceae bacterium]MCF8249004.1 DoxX family protein [Saprospiraceae bacterium]MCF8283249.1 DoxX family protein [Bacteroidales bacterium]MCF8310898.1 DoxX family protein [Saprospiraceae bacterium]MCF8439514.1 DoxX family protein [Saprospiraceae bacterium]
MKQFDNFFSWFNRNQSIAYSLTRIFLGIALLARGLFLLNNPGALTQLIDENTLYMWFSYITIAHIAGGLSLILGLFTRFGSLIQIPILATAVFVVHAEKGLMMGGQSLELAALVLFLLVIYFLFGSGTFSLDQYFSQKKSGAVAPN